MASGILEKHSEVASFGAIQIESNEIMSTLKTSMYAHLGYDTKTKPRVLSENIKLLMDLGEDPAELSVKYLVRQLVSQYIRPYCKTCVYYW